PGAVDDSHGTAPQHGPDLVTRHPDCGRTRLPKARRTEGLPRLTGSEPGRAQAGQAVQKIPLGAGTLGGDEGCEFREAFEVVIVGEPAGAVGQLDGEQLAEPGGSRVVARRRQVVFEPGRLSWRLLPGRLEAIAGAVECAGGGLVQRPGGGEVL